MVRNSRMNLRKILSGDINRLRYIKRYSTSLVFHQESVAEHTMYTALYAMFLADQCSHLVEVDRGVLLRRCLLHDLEECRTGDSPRPFKYRNSELNQLIERVSEVMLEETLEESFNETWSAYYMHLWKSAKDDSIEGRIVRFSDYLSVLSHLWAETRTANTTVLDNYTTLKEYTDSFDDSRYDFIREYVDEAREIFTEMVLASGLEV